MSAMFAFNEGEVLVRSATFEYMMVDLLEHLTEEEDRAAITDAMSLNCLWIDQLRSSQRSRILLSISDLINLYLAQQDLDDTATTELRTLLDELVARYPDVLDGPA